jgi:hypothetical protein
MADREKDLGQLFMRDLDEIELPPRGRWRPAPRKESQFVKTSRFVLSAAAVAAVLVLALIASAGLRERNQVAATPSPILTPTTAPATSTPSPSSSASVAPSPTTPPTGAITGTLSYPSNFIPPLTVYAVSVTDQSVFFSVQTPLYGGGGDPNAASPPAQVPPSGIPVYTITGVAPGTYYVFAYRDDNVPNDLGGPALYSRFVLTCMQPSRAGLPYPSGACDGGPTADHSLVPVTVGPGEKVSGIDPSDWTNFQQVQQGNLPPRPR